ncbi:MAG TPA: hypothetical protein VFB04_06590 [Terriglobales bacterium]|nr:hypothetical protein [Terriglobales bacterium]
MMRGGVRLGLVLTALGAVALLAPMRKSGLVLAGAMPSVSLNAAQAQPRQVEETTEKAVARDYAAAWQAMAEALDQNRTDLLAASFIGTANDKLRAGIEQQRKTGLHQRIVDKGHTADIVFYSPEGSAMELHDTARLELQTMDGGKVLHSENATIHYVALLTAAENSWKVRVMEAVPEGQ